MMSNEYEFVDRPYYNINYNELEERNLQGVLALNEEECQGFNLKVCTWNVNGIRTRILKNVERTALAIEKNYVTEFDEEAGLGKLIKDHDPDIFCLQETRICDAYMERVNIPGWRKYTSESKGETKAKRGPNQYSGTAIFVKDSICEPRTVLTSLDGLEKDEGRFIALEFALGDQSFWLVNVYAPNAGSNYKHKIQSWNPTLTQFLNSLTNVIFCGDLNVARTIYDLSRSTKKEYAELTPEVIDEQLTVDDRAGFTAKERLWIEETIDNGFTDTWRLLHPKEKNTGYTYIESFRRTEMRIDYHLTKLTMPHRINSCKTLEYNKKFSDHVPLLLNITF